MGQFQNITKQRKYTHISERERYQLEVLLSRRVSVPEISQTLGRHKSNIYREIARGQIKRLTSELTEIVEYRANVAQSRYKEKVSNRERGLKIGKDHALADYIRKKIIKDRYSPDVLLGEIKTKGLCFKTQICTKTLYNYLERGIIYGVSSKDLWEGGRRRKKSHRKPSVSLRNRSGQHISKRPIEAQTRLEYGHWEIDSVVSGKKKGKAALLTLTERKTREEIIRKIPGATKKAVANVFCELEKEYGLHFRETFKTITADNGSEFLDWQRLEESSFFKGEKRTILYFATPYSSWERGTNENHNRMIRRFIPKGSNISKVSKKTIKEKDLT